MKADTASQHRAAATLALAFGTAVISSFAGTFALDVRTGIALNFRVGEVSGASWAAPWLPGAVSPAEQQQAAIEQWLHVILVFGAIAFAVALANALIGFVSHANERRHETAVRGLVGASRRTLTAALLRNALINAALGIMAGVPIGIAAARSVRAQWLQPGAADYADWILLACAAALAAAAFSARSASRRLSRPGWMGDALAPEARTVPGFGAEDLRALLTGAQLACAVALTTVSLLVWSYATSRSAASAKEHAGRYVAHVSLAEDTTPAERQVLYAQISNALRASGQVEAESIASAGALLGIGTIDKVVSDCGPCARANMYTPIFALEAQHHVTGADFFATAGIRVLHGSEFGGSESDGGKIVVNELFARQAFMGQSAIGKRVLVGGFVGGQWYTVIGVVENVRPVALQTLEPDPALGEAAQAGILPAIYFSAAEHAPARFDVIVRADKPPVAQAGLSFEPLTNLMVRAAAPQKSFSRVLTVLGLLLCGAALVGSFTTTMLSVRSREAEIAVRRAVGARRTDVWRLVYRRVAAITSRGVLAGIVLSFAIARALEVFVPGLPALNLRTLLIVAASFFAIAFVAALLPLRAALRISPATHH